MIANADREPETPQLSVSGANSHFGFTKVELGTKKPAEFLFH